MRYWAFQANPLKYPIIDELKRMCISYWSINPKIQKMGEVEAGDTAFIWKSDGRDRNTRGIYAVAKILSVSNHTEPCTPERVDERAEELRIDWIDKEEGERRVEWSKAMLEYTKLLLHRPLLALEIKAVPNLEDLLILNMPRRGQYALTEDQGKAVEKMIESR